MIIIHTITNSKLSTIEIGDALRWAPPYILYGDGDYSGHEKYS